ncbi:MAG: hypothetical protein AAB444_00265 [Patescibacteria group bacterium]
MKKHHGKIALTAGSALIVGFGAGILITLPFATTKISPQYDEGFQAGFEDARLKLAQANILPPEQEELTSISGIIISIRDNVLQIQANPTVLNPLEPPAPVDRTILISPTTALSRLIQKSPEAFSKEQTAWIAAFSKRKPGEAPPLPPSPAAEQTITIADIKTGDRITATADQNIKMLQKFEAKTITISQK